MREAKNISIEQIADHLGIWLNTYKKIEYGERLPTIDDIKIMSTVFHVDSSIFLQDHSTSVTTNGNYSPEIGDVIINEKEVLLDFSKALNRFADAIEKLVTRQK